MARIFYDKDVDLEILRQRTMAIIGFGSQVIVSGRERNTCTCLCGAGLQWEGAGVRPCIFKGSWIYWGWRNTVNL